MRLHHLVEGPPTAPAVVLSPALGTTLAMWDAQAETLAERYRVVRYDRRGHGQSPLATGPATIDELGGDLVELLDGLGLERVSFCGISLGGLVGMWLAVNAPERVDRLVVACGTAAFAPRQNWVDRAATVRAESVAAIADAALARWFRPAFHAEHPEVVARFRAMLVSTPAEGYAACCDALAAADLWPRVSEIAAPTLVLTGAEDPVVPAETGDRLAAAIPQARHVVIQAAAHIANVEQARTFTAALAEHLGFEEGER